MTTSKTMPSPHAHKVQCYTCGGPPVFEIDTCSRCHCIQHMHCMPLFPSKIVENWVCEECQSKDAEYTPKFRPKQGGIDAAGRKHSKKLKAVPTGKVKYLSPEEVKMLSSGGPFRIIKGNKGPLSPTRHEKQKKFRPVESVYAAEKAKMVSSPETPCAAVIGKDERGNPSPREDVTIVAPIPANRETSDMPGKSLVAAEELRDSVSDKGESEENVLKYSVPRPYLPALHYTWRGALKFTDTEAPAESYFCFKAHPPSRVHRKAYELSQKMPPLLQVNFTPHCHLQADLFQHGHPEVHDLSLYFFPVDKADRPDYICELMDLQHSVITTSIEGVELLIFTSKQLEIDPYDVCGGLYSNFLGGVFHRPKNPQVAHLEVSFPVDMEIDMVGGKSVGGSDLVIPKLASLNLSISSGTVTTDGIDMQKSDVNKIVSSLVLQGLNQEECGESVISPQMNIKPEIQSTGSEKEEQTKTKKWKGQEDRLYLGEFTSPAAVSSNVTWTVKVKAEEREFEDNGSSACCKLLTESPSKREKPLCWHAPPLNWVKLNIAVSLGRENHSTATAAGLVRDDSGRWLVGYSLKSDTSKTLEAELSALLEGAKLLLDRGYKKVIVEFASLLAVTCLAIAPLASDPDRALIDICRDITTRRLDCKVHNIQRCQNLCADWLASHSKCKGDRLEVFEIPPLELVTLLQNDCSYLANR